MRAFARANDGIRRYALERSIERFCCSGVRSSTGIRLTPSSMPVARDHPNAVSVCVCVCVRVSAFVCVCVCLRVCLWAAGWLCVRPIKSQSVSVSFVFSVCLLPVLRRRANMFPTVPVSCDFGVRSPAGRATNPLLVAAKVSDAASADDGFAFSHTLFGTRGSRHSRGAFAVSDVVSDSRLLLSPRRCRPRQGSSSRCCSIWSRSRCSRARASCSRVARTQPPTTRVAG